MKQSESINKLLEAFAKAQAEFTTLPKDKSGYGYKYTDLDTVISTVRPILAKNGLGFMQSLTTLETGKSGITTRIFSAGGEYIEDTIALPEISVGKTNAAQNMGAAITYMKRYALCAILGISSDEDTDAATGREQTGRQNNAFDGMSKAAQMERNNFKKQERVTLPGGPDTPAQNAEIKRLFNMQYSDGEQIFSQNDVEMFSSMRTQKTADELIAYLNKVIDERIAKKSSRNNSEGI